MADEEKKKRQLTGTALEVDVIKKISHQLARAGLSVDALERIVRFVQSAVGEKRIDQLRNMEKNGQFPLPESRISRTPGPFTVE